MIDFGRFDALTFDCYGTLIDWETGLLEAFAPVEGDDLLERYGRHEAALEAGPYRRYREVVSESFRRVGEELGSEPSSARMQAFGAAVADWPAFPDSAAALARLRERFTLGVITNCDDDLFAASSAKLGDPFSMVVTAEQVGAYKPDTRGFDEALRRLDLPRERVLHVAQSLFHDHAPAKRLGFTTVWIDRRGGRGGGATPDAEAAPDAVFADMKSFADAVFR